MISDAGTLPLILYSHDQLLVKIAELKDNALYLEKISTESAPAPKKSKPSRKSPTKAPSTSTSQPEASSSRPSDPQHSEEQLVFPETVVTASSPLRGVVDVHAEMYNLPSLAVLYELMVYLHTSYKVQLRPVSTCF